MGFFIGGSPFSFAGKAFWKCSAILLASALKFSRGIIGEFSAEVGDGDSSTWGMGGLFLIFKKKPHHQTKNQPARPKPKQNNNKNYGKN